jgi:hypothetical protein
MRCRTVQPQLLDFSSGRLDPAAARGVAAHLAECAGCRRLQQRELDVASLLGSLPQREPPAAAWATVEAALRRHTSSGSRRRVQRRYLARIGGLAAAAALASGLMISPRPSMEPRSESDVLQALSPSGAAGLGSDRDTDPLLAVQSRVDWFLEGVAEHGS